MGVHFKIISFYYILIPSPYSDAGKAKCSLLMVTMKVHFCIKIKVEAVYV